jgi:hypothetical protein
VVWKQIRQLNVDSNAAPFRWKLTIWGGGGGHSSTWVAACDKGMQQIDFHPPPPQPPVATLTRSARMR